MREVVVNITFRGDVKVLVPDHLSVEMGVYLAQQVALARSVAT